MSLLTLKRNLALPLCLQQQQSGAWRACVIFSRRQGITEDWYFDIRVILACCGWPLFEWDVFCRVSKNRNDIKMLFLLTGFTPHQNFPKFPETLQKVNKHTFCQHVCGECVSVTSSTPFINGRRSFICSSSLLLSSPFECQVSPTPQLTSDPTDPLSFSIFTITIVFTSMMHPPVLPLSLSPLPLLDPACHQQKGSPYTSLVLLQVSSC